MSINEKLLKIRQSVSYLQKTENGNQGAKYVDPAALIRKLRDRMNENGIILVPALSGATVEQIPLPSKNNPNAVGFFFKSAMTYTFIEVESGDRLEVPWFCTGKHAQDPSMAGGSALTYFERYFLLKFFQIPTAKDDPEYFDKRTKDPELPKQISIGEHNVNWLMRFCKDHNLTAGDDKKEFMAHYGFDVYGTTVDEFNAIKVRIETDYNEV